jgi:hypothetical protein
MGRLGAELRRLRAALQPLRARGFGSVQALLWQLPAAVALRGWRRLTRPINGRVLSALSNGPRLAKFQATLPVFETPPLYVVVMPQVLHFLAPCLALLRGRAPLVLVGNGAAGWEMEWLRQRLPEAPQFRLRRLPGTSVEHGEVLGLLLQYQRGDFGIIDHDCYLLDPGLLSRLRPLPGDAIVTPWADTHEGLPLPVPLTHLMFLHAQPLQALMHRSGISPRLYRHTPRAARPAFRGLGLAEGQYLKPYQRFHDTLHVLLALALAQDLGVRVVAPEGDLPLAHIGGTSIGSHHTKSLFALHVHLRFLDLVGDDGLRRRYARLTHPLRSAGEALLRRRPQDPGWDGLPLVEALLPHLRRALHEAWPALHPPEQRNPP